MTQIGLKPGSFCIGLCLGARDVFGLLL